MCRVASYNFNIKDNNMKKIILLILAFWAGVVSGFADQSKVTGKALLNANTRYVFRGITLSNQPITRALVKLNYVGLYGIIDTYSHFDTQRMQDIKMTSGYKYSTDSFVILAQHTKYTIIDGPDTHEVGLGITYQGIIKPFLFLYRDLDAGDGYYLELGFGYDIYTYKKIALSIDSKISAVSGNEVFGRNTKNELFNNLYHGEMTVNIKGNLNSELLLVMNIGYTTSLTKDSHVAIKDIGIELVTERVYASIGFSLEF